MKIPTSLKIITKEDTLSFRKVTINLETTSQKLVFIIISNIKAAKLENLVSLVKAAAQLAT